MTLSVVMDRTPVIRASLHDVERTLAISVALVILVVFVFLRSTRATLIPIVAVPVSLISTFGVMYLCGYSLDNLSLMALTIATGFVVDDAIVVLENISRYREQGIPPLQAALRGAKEITFTVLSMSLSLVAVFLPILLMGGMVGRLFREFAVTLCVAIIVSLLVSLTTTPMMCALLLKPEQGTSHGWWYRMNERFFEWIRGGYATSLTWVLRHPRSMLAVTLATMGVSIYLYGRKYDQYGAYVHLLEAARRTTPQRRSSDRQAARQTCQGAGRADLSASGPGFADRRARQQFSISVHPTERRSG
jgi:multidrug efflux pump